MREHEKREPTLYVRKNNKTIQVCSGNQKGFIFPFSRKGRMMGFHLISKLFDKWNIGIILLQCFHHICFSAVRISSVFSNLNSVEGELVAYLPSNSLPNICNVKSSNEGTCVFFIAKLRESLVHISGKIRSTLYCNFIAIIRKEPLVQQNNLVLRSAVRTIALIKVLNTESVFGFLVLHCNRARTTTSTTTTNDCDLISPGLTRLSLFRRPPQFLFIFLADPVNLFTFPFSQSIDTFRKVTK